MTRMRRANCSHPRHAGEASAHGAPQNCAAQIVRRLYIKTAAAQINCEAALISRNHTRAAPISRNQYSDSTTV